MKYLCKSIIFKDPSLKHIKFKKKKKKKLKFGEGSKYIVNS